MGNELHTTKCTVVCLPAVLLNSSWSIYQMHMSHTFCIHICRYLCYQYLDVLHWPFFDERILSIHWLTDWLIDSAGPDSSLSASKLGGAPDLQRALSLLSASSCGLPDPVLQASCLVQFTGASQNSRALPPSHGGSSASASFVEGHQPMAPSSQLVRFTLDGSSNGYESTFFGLNQMNWCVKRMSHCRVGSAARAYARTAPINQLEC
jgi:hypothetical protein